MIGALLSNGKVLCVASSEYSAANLYNKVEESMKKCGAWIEDEVEVRCLWNDSHLKNILGGTKSLNEVRNRRRWNNNVIVL